MKGIWSKFKGNSEYQLENAQDRALYLEPLHLILQEFDLKGVSKKLELICFFQESP